MSTENKKINFYPNDEDSLIINRFTARLVGQGKSGHAASRQVVVREALRALAEKEALIEKVCSEGSPV